MSGGGSTDLPHWTDPPTGEVPRILPESATPNGDDLAAWQALGARGMRWRDDGDDWNDAEELGALGGDETRVGALDTSRTDHSDLYSFDEEFERLEEERSGSHGAVAIDEFDDPLEPEPERISSSVRTGPPARGERPGGHARPPRPRPAPRRPGAPGGPGGGRDLGPALVVGAGLVVLLGICYAIGPKALMVLSAAVVLAAAIEAFGMVWRSGFRPATLLGLTGSVGVVAAAYWRGEPAIPLVTVLVFGATMLWYVLRIVDGRPLVNVAVTTMTFVWVGVSGSFASLLLRAPHGGHLFLGAVIPTVVADIAAYLIGSRFGSHLLAPELSPGKTWEGIAAGAAGAIVAGVIIGNRLGPWGGVKHGFELGLVVAVVAPVGDLFESMIKRDLSVKDSGTALPGHGGILDRFDSMLLVLPAVYFLATLFNIIR